MEHNRYIPCTVYDSKQLVEKLSRFDKEDELRLVGFVRAYSIKKNDKWENRVEVRITEIKNEPPKRERRRKQVDEDIPEEYR
jgi:hypothetical protein